MAAAATLINQKMPMKMATTIQTLIQPLISREPPPPQMLHLKAEGGRAVDLMAVAHRSQ